MQALYEKLCRRVHDALFLKRAVPALFLLLTGSYFYGTVELESELTRLKSNEILHVRLGVSALSHHLEAVTHDLLFLANHSTLIEAVNNPNQENLFRLAGDFANFSRSKRIYDQIRWLDETGMEQVRVDYQASQPLIVPAENLQNKASRYYFTSTLKLDPGEIFISPLDLNIEQGEVEIPFKPMIRIGIPVFDRQGLKRGIVLLNYYGRVILQAFSNATVNCTAHSSMLNNEGYWLKSPNANDEWGFMLNRQDLKLSRRNPASWEKIRSKAEGTVLNANGLWVWDTVYPLMDVMRSSMAATETFDPARSEMAAQDYFWKVVVHLENDVIDSLQTTILLKVVGIGSLLLTLVILISWRLARAEQEVRRVNAVLERESREQLALALEAANLGLWDWHPNSGTFHTNDIFLTMLGYTPDAFPESTERWSSLIHPDDLQATQAILQPYLDGDDTFYRSEHRMRTADGQWKWILDVGRVIQRNDQGKAERFTGIHIDITESKLAEQKMALTHRILEQSLNEIYTFDKNTFRFVNVNEGARKNLGYSMAELQDMTLLDINPEMTADLLAKRIKPLIAGSEERIVFTTTHTRKNGSHYPVEVHLQLMQEEPPLFVAIIIDITERRENEAELRELTARQQKITNRVPGIVYQFKLRPDGSACIPYTNDAIREIFRLSPEEVREDAAEVFALCHPDDYNELIDSFQESALTLKPWRLEFRVRFTDGTVRWLFGNSVPERSPDGSVLWYGFITDITEKKQIEQQLLLAQQRAEEANQAKSNFLANISREIRTPINAIIAMSKLALDTDLEVKQKNFIEKVHLTAHSLLGIMNDILLTIKMEMGESNSLAKEQPAHLGLSSSPGARILLVADNESHRQLLMMLQSQEGMVVTCAGNGAEIEKALETGLYDCLLIDMQMSMMDGYAACREVRQQPHLHELAIIALVATHISDDDRDKARQAGINDFITQPYNEDKVLKAIARWCPMPANTSL